jgi:DNA-binding transcriptional ArsR family regulator/rhodanese-related sulfurtransferase
MTASAAHRRFKDGLYAQLARIGKAVANPHRLELLELLAQTERTVESLAKETEMTIANTSQHLQALRQAGLIESRKDGLYVHYRLADPTVADLSRSLRVVAEQRLAELERLVARHFTGRAEMAAVGMEELLQRASEPDVVIVDTRPSSEYEAGHIAGAISLPFDEVETQLRKLAKNKHYVAYCRGPYCVYADRAVEALVASGRRASRLKEGFPEWRSAGHPIESGPPKPRSSRITATRPS